MGKLCTLQSSYFSDAQQINCQKWLYAAGGLQASHMQQHVLLFLLTLPLLSHLPLQVATNQSVMVKNTLCQTPTNHCTIIDRFNLSCILLFCLYSLVMSGSKSEALVRLESCPVLEIKA